MDHSGDRLTLYAAQAAPVLAALERDGVCHSRAEYVQKKYGESAPIFLTAYHWFVQQLPRFVPKPEGAEFPYWAFRELYSLDQAGTAGVLKLQVPKEQAVLFDLEDWTKITQLRYIGKDAALDGVDAISGATITSTAYEKCVQDAFAAFDLVKEG